MAKAESITTIGIVVAIFLQSQRCAAVTCVKRGTELCICDMDDGSGWIDLAQISKTDGTAYFTKIPGKANWHYSYNPCAIFTDNKCKDNTMVCQAGATVCGKSTSLQWAITGTAPLSGSITYGNGDELKKVPRVTVVSFTCDDSVEADFKYTDENPGGHYEFKLVSKHACLVPTPTQPPPTTTARPRPRDNKISLGTIMDICVIFALIGYGTVGFSYMYMRRGSRGREALPNYAFWIGFPGLVKDGAMFIFNKVRAIRRFKPGYEAI